MSKITRIGIRSVHLGILFGEEFFFLPLQRLPICHVDPLEISGQWIC